MRNGSVQESTGITSDNIGGCGIGFVASTHFPKNEKGEEIAKKMKHYCSDVMNIRKKKRSRNKQRIFNRRKQEARLLAKIRELLSLYPWLDVPEGIFT